MFIRVFRKRRFCKVKAAVLPSKSGSFAKRKRRFCFVKEYVLYFHLQLPFSEEAIKLWAAIVT